MLSGRDHREEMDPVSIIQQAEALVQAIKALGRIEPRGLIERVIVGVLLAAYKRRLRGIAAIAPDGMIEGALDTSEHIGDG